MVMQFGRGRVALALLLGAIAASMLAGVVTAHSELVSSSPAEGASVPSPFSGPIVLTFSEHLAKGSKADLLRGDGTTVASATVGATTMTFNLDTPLVPGGYSVQWVSIADDTDLLRGIVHFTVSAAAASPSASTSAAPSASSSTSTTPTSSPSPSQSVPASAGPSPSGGGDTSGGGGSDVLLPIVVALVVLGAGAAYLLTQRNRPSNPA
jgi:methionine-rich copper-binding protein CopC